MAQQATAVVHTNGTINKLHPDDRSAHDWYRFVLSFPPHLVRKYVHEFELGASQCVLDPFCGTGTTLVECKKLGVPSVGVEATPIGHLASSVKVNRDVDPDDLVRHATDVADRAVDKLKSQGIEDNPVFYPEPGEYINLRALPLEISKLLLKDSISPLPLHKTLVLLEALEQNYDGRFDNSASL